MADYRSCDNCAYTNISMGDYPCNECIRNATDKWKSLTNADKIRSMGDEELAEFLVNFKNTYGEEYEGEMSCFVWLQSEAE